MQEWTHEQAREELAYIQSIDPLSPGNTFNCDPECFLRYCTMQLKSILKSFPDSAWYYKTIQDAIDIIRCR